MKTPREILFARHQADVPKLDAIRREAVAGLNRQGAKAQSWPMFLVTWCLGGSNKFWQELIFPCRRIWTGLAAVWVLLFIVNLSQRDGPQFNEAKSSPPTEMMMTFRDQQKILNDLLADRLVPAEAMRPKIFSPKPRTEITKVLTA
jgi:hypothetical protein